MVTASVIEPQSSFARIWAVVRAISRGSVMTYGEVARLAGFSRGARLVGRAMHAGSGLPWQRVVALSRPGFGRISIRDPATRDLQRALLESEGVTFGESGEIDLQRYGGLPPPLPRPRAKAGSKLSGKRSGSKARSYRARRRRRSR